MRGSKKTPQLLKQLLANFIKVRYYFIILTLSSRIFNQNSSISERN